MTEPTYDRTIDPWLARVMVGDPNAIVGAGKIIFWSDRERRSEAGCVGAAVVDLPDTGGKWEMVAGTMIIVPCSPRFVWKDGPCGWRVDQLLTDGLKQENWKPKQ